MNINSLLWYPDGKLDNCAYSNNINYIYFIQLWSEPPNLYRHFQVIFFYWNFTSKLLPINCERPKGQGVWYETVGPLILPKATEARALMINLSSALMRPTSLQASFSPLLPISALAKDYLQSFKLFYETSNFMIYTVQTLYKQG